MAVHINIEGVLGHEDVANIARTYAAAGARQAVEESNAAFPARQRRLNLLGT